MACAEYKEGDIVQLKSGGPKMTVSSVREDYRDYYCLWFKGANKEGGYFTDEVLKASEG